MPETIAAGAAAYAISVLIMKRSILTEKIARRGRHILREYTVDALEFLLAGQLMTRDPETLPASMAVPDAVASSPRRPSTVPIRSSTRTGGCSALSRGPTRLRWQVGKARRKGNSAMLLSDASTLVAYPETPCGEVADMMVDSGTGRVPIVDPQTPARGRHHLAPGPAQGAHHPEAG